MSREEAIDLLDNLIGMVEDNHKSDYDTALQMGIKALEQEPCEDVISRQAVLDITWEEPSYTDALNVLTEVRDKVKELPSVNPQEKTGHWIDRDVYDADRWKCSECGRTEPYKEDYCPKCGAKMN